MTIRLRFSLEQDRAVTSPLVLSFDRGSLVVSAPEGHPTVRTLPGLVWDPRIMAFRAAAFAYRDLVTQLVRTGTAYTDQAARYEKLELVHRAEQPPREYQVDALAKWRKGGRRGVVVLPTGAGKSYLAELAIADAGRAALVVAPTLDLVHQWQAGLARAFGQEVGVMGGGEFSLRPLTVTTYDSAWMHLERHGDRFGLLIFDECHHLPGPSYSMAAEGSIAPFRLGLTATLEREDGGHRDLEQLIGPVVYRQEIKDLAGTFLAEYQVVRIAVDLEDEEQAEYAEMRAIFRDFLELERISIGAPDGFSRFIRQAARSREGRAAMQAFRRSRQIALAAPSKLDRIERLLLRHRDDRMLIFTHENSLAFDISRRFLLPTITHHTEAKERREVLEGFKNGTFPAIVTSKVLNEGVDLPSANVGVIVSGSSSVREHVQRLGRLLRRQPDKEAFLYELVTRRILEERVSDRRREHDAYR